ncbi:MAG: hypothetical protein RLZZ524_1969, partial [Pseudomonadota bacterium]
MSAQTPTTDEATQLAIRTYRGIELGLGQAVPVAAIAAKIEAQHPGHLVLVQAGKFLHGYDRSAYALATLKGYKLKLVGTTDAPHIRVGFPAGNFKRRLWSMVADFGIPWAVALGTQASGHTVYVSTQPTGNSQVLDGVTPEIVAEVIEDLRQRNEVNKLAARELLTHPDTACFQLKAKTQELDTQILQDVARMPRDWRATYGESLRACMARILRAVMAYGLEENKPALLRGLSADLDCLKHYIAQAPQLSRLTLAFEHRAGLAVELGRLVGGLIRSMARPFVGRSGPEPFRLIPIGCATQFDVGSPCRQRRLLTSAFFGAHDSLATGKNVVGFGDPDGAATKPLCSQQAAFSLFGASSFGRAEWESRKALPVLHRFANPFG